jgi:hypothetical protein
VLHSNELSSQATNHRSDPILTDPKMALKMGNGYGVYPKHSYLRGNNMKKMKKYEKL